VHAFRTIGLDAFSGKLVEELAEGVHEEQRRATVGTS
jgi:hypothetical protein